MTFLLDTTVLVDVLRGRNGRRELLAQLLLDGHKLTTSAINAGEVYAGVRAGEEARTTALFDRLSCVPVTCSIAQSAGALSCTWGRKGKTLALADMLVAATALEHGYTLMTDNRKDFPIAELQFYSLP